MDLVEALQCRALINVLEPDREAWLRHVKRCYSKWFHTPLHLVDDLPVEDVLLAYYEEAFEEMSEEDRLKNIERLKLTPEERQKAEDDDEEFLQKLNREIEESAKKKKAAKEPSKDKEQTKQEPSAEKPKEDETVIDVKFDNGNLLNDQLLFSDPLAF